MPVRPYLMKVATMRPEAHGGTSQCFGRSVLAYLRTRYVAVMVIFYFVSALLFAIDRTAFLKASIAIRILYCDTRLLAYDCQIVMAVKRLDAGGLCSS